MHGIEYSPHFGSVDSHHVADVMDKTVLVDLGNEVDVVGNYFADSCFVGNSVDARKN